MTKLLRREKIGVPAPEPPPGTFELVHFPSHGGSLAAYVSPRPEGEKKHPAIVWLVGGFSSSISEIAWTPGLPRNDQSASAFREEGVVMMYPSLRGGNENPGAMEVCFGEVDDVISAADFLATLEYVDPRRIYLGGHSTGGTLAMLVSECSDRFRAVFAFGPVEEVAGYGSEVLPFDTSDPRELELRAPGRWLASIHTPTFVIEGADGRSNIESLRAMARLPHPGSVHFLPVAGADHFSTLAPITRLLAKKILADGGATTKIAITEQELVGAVKK